MLQHALGLKLACLVILCGLEGGFAAGATEALALDKQGRQASVELLPLGAALVKAHSANEHLQHTENVHQRHAQAHRHRLVRLEVQQTSWCGFVAGVGGTYSVATCAGVQQPSCKQEDCSTFDTCRDLCWQCSDCKSFSYALYPAQHGGYRCNLTTGETDSFMYEADDITGIVPFFTSTELPLAFYVNNREVKCQLHGTQPAAAATDQATETLQGQSVAASSIGSTASGSSTMMLLVGGGVLVVLIILGVFIAVTRKGSLGEADARALPGGKQVQEVAVQRVAPALGMAEKHHTDDFAELAQSQWKGWFKIPENIFRRGDVITLKIAVKAGGSKATLGVELKDNFDKTAPSMTFPFTMDASGIDDMKCVSMRRSETEVELQLKLPAHMPIGEYTLTSTMTGPLRARQPMQSLVLMNPWCAEADEFLADERGRQEWIMLESGLVFYGSWQNVQSMGWTYGQFEPRVLAAVLRILRQLRHEDRATPALLARSFSSHCNADDVNGVLMGNWSGDFAGGTQPWRWTGSPEILASWAYWGKPVKYGQCWVFASVLTTCMRCVGIAARPVTNYRSAHDTHGNRMVEFVFDETGEKTGDSEDSVWNFHVWTEVYMARPDLKPGMGGWQAIDATPQEMSNNKYQMGPASVAGVKLGYQLPFDSDFVIAEVNADVRRYVKAANGEFILTAVDKTDVGRCMYTKALGSWDPGGENIIQRYKAPEGSGLERAALLRLERIAEAKVDPQGELAMDLNAGAALTVGQPLTVRLHFKRSNAVRYPASVTLAIRVLATEYTGKGQTVLGNQRVDLPFDVAETQGVSLTLDTTSPSFSKMMSGSGFPVTVVGTAIWQDTRPGREGRNCTLLRDESFELTVPQVQTVSVQPPPKMGQQSMIALAFQNPFPNRPLTNVNFTLEGAILLQGQVPLAVGTVQPGETKQLVFKIQPHGRRQTSFLLVSKVWSSEIEGIGGQHVIQLE